LRIAIVDYGLGNLRSVTNALAHLGVEPLLTGEAGELARADGMILPGVGAFGDGMAGLKQRGLTGPVVEWAGAGRPLLGICLGLQLFFEESSESPGVAGLGLLRGRVERFAGPRFGVGERLKIPHMGWNSLTFPRPHHLFSSVPSGAFFYFVHSYCCVPARTEDVLAESDYGGGFCAAAGRGNVLGCQFHPEKSQQMGLRVLRNFLALARSGATAAREEARK